MRYPQTAAIIRSARLRKGMSQERAASEVGCSRLQFIRWEQGIHKPNPDGLGRQLVDVLGLDKSALEGADEDEEAALPMRSLAADLQQLASLAALLERNPDLAKELA